MAHPKNKNQTVIKTIGDDGNVLIKDCPVLIPKENIDMFMELSADADINAKRWEEFGNSYKKKLIEKFVRAVNSKLLSENFDFNSVNKNNNLLSDDFTKYSEDKMIDLICDYINKSRFKIYKDDITRYEIQNIKGANYIYVAYYAYNNLGVDPWNKDIKQWYYPKDSVKNTYDRYAMEMEEPFRHFLSENGKYNVEFRDGYKTNYLKYTGSFNEKTRCMYINKTNATRTRKNTIEESEYDEYDYDNFLHTQYFIIPGECLFKQK